MKAGQSALISMVLATQIASVRAQTPEEWFVMVLDIQNEIERADAQGRKLTHIDQEDRRFVRKMINDLTVSEDAMPTKAQAKWLRKLKGWVEK
jgi:hypothetical protein